MGRGGSTKPNKGGKKFPAEDAQIKINASSHVQIYHVTLGNDGAAQAHRPFAVATDVELSFLPQHQPYFIYNRKFHFGMIVDSNHNNFVMVCKRIVVSFSPTADSYGSNSETSACSRRIISGRTAFIRRCN